MRTLDRYIGVTVISYTIASLLVLVVLQVAFAFIDEVGDVGKGAYTSLMAFQYILLTIPGRIHEMFPISALLGSLLGLGAMAGNSELVVIRSSGISVYRIVRSVLQAGLILMIFSFIIGEWISPTLEGVAQMFRANAISNKLSVMESGGFWVKDGSQIINVEQTVSDSYLQNIRIEEFDRENRLIRVLEAKDAQFNGTAWEMRKVIITRVGIDGITIENKASSIWKSDLRPDTLGVVTSKPENLSIIELDKFIEYQLANGLESKKYKMAFWSKIVSPFSTLVMLMIAIPFVFGSLRSVGTGQRLMVGVLLGIGFFLLNKILGTSALLYGLNEFVCASFPTILFLILGIVGVKRVA